METYQQGALLRQHFTFYGKNLVVLQGFVFVQKPIRIHKTQRIANTLNKESTINWLLERFRFDVEARSLEIESHFLEYFEKTDHIRILDLGTGTGSNYFYYNDHIPAHQTWYLFEENAQLIQFAKQNILKSLLSKKAVTTSTLNSIRSIKQGKQIHIKFFDKSQKHLQQLIAPNQVDLVMGNAFFDRLKQPEILPIVHWITSNKLCFMPTMNYIGMTFTPFGGLDRAFIKKFEHYQYHESLNRPTMGSACVDNLCHYFREKSYAVHKSQSPWIIKAQDKRMLSQIIDRMEASFAQMDMGNIDEDTQQIWLNYKRNLIEDELLSIKVEHEDILTYPAQ